MADEPTAREAEVDARLQRNDKDGAVQLLFDLITHHAQAKDFTKAEALRERLMAVDDMALDKIIKSAEVIEAAKSSALDHYHLETFKALYERLNDEETNALYFALRHSRGEPGKALYCQGDANARLFFLNQGQLKLYFTREGKDNLIAILEPGTIAGQDGFFHASYCTTSLALQTAATVLILEMSAFERWKSELPSLADKLQQYCRDHDLRKLFSAKGLERRMSRRVKVEGLAVTQILNEADQPVGKPFRGDVADVSNTGLSFYLKATDKAARMLLGRRLQMQITLHAAGKAQTLERKALTVAVNPLYFGDYSVHVKFDKPLKSG